MFTRSNLTVLCVALLAAVATGKPHPFRSRRSPGELIKNYDVVRPRILHKDSFLPYPKLLEVEICNGNSNFTLQLELNENLVPPHFTSKHYDQDGKEIVTVGQANCFYHGKVLEHPEWSVVVSTCTGLRASFGVYGSKDQYYLTEPLDHDVISVEEAHVLYSDSELRTESGTCGSDHASPRIPENMHMHITDKDQERIRERRQSVQFYFVELVLVNDHAQYHYNGRSLSKTVQKSLEIANEMDNLYCKLPLQVPIRISLVDVITWTQGDQIASSTDPFTLHDNFQEYYIRISSPHDASLLITGKNLDDSTVGIAFLCTMCDDEYSVGLVQDGSRSDAAVTAAHELGHILCMVHDDYRNCGCPDGRGNCIMASFAKRIPPTKWSQCSINELNEGLNRYDLDYCLFNTPMTTFGPQTCGDGIREGDEECDCGSASKCMDPCCNAATCRLVAGAECSPVFSHCCNSTCQLKAYGTTCRAASGACDIAEYCSGTSAECPADSHHRDGTSCNNGQAHCFGGECSKTLNQQCRELFGTFSSPAHTSCFDENTRGTKFGNCGYTTTDFLPCASRDVQCGMLYCSGGDFQSFGIDGHNITHNEGTSRECMGFTPKPTDIRNPALVDDGTICGTGKFCHEQKCKDVSSVLGQQTCPSSSSQECSGNGICSNKGMCVCDIGYIGENCENRHGSVCDGGCEQICIATNSSIQCSCQTGYQLNSDGKSCSNINECDTNNGGCSQVCRDTEGSFRCSCRNGYTLASDGRSCNNINECSIINGGCSHTCTDTQGSFMCSCNSGYTLCSDGTSCNNINECNTNNGGCSQMCTDTQGSFRCSCISGYTLASDEKSCNNINECSTNNGGCSQICTNTRGSFRCSCRSGYILASNGKNCSNINECSTNNGGCSEICTDTQGSFKCSCRSGYTLADDGKSCNDINECNTNNGGCSHTCTDTQGSYQCSCDPGYQLSSDQHSCVLTATCGVLTTATGFVESEGWPEQYSKNSDCDWIISLPDSSNRVNITFNPQAYGLAGNPPCTRDYVEIFDGPIANNLTASLGRFCGCCADKTPAPFTASGSLVKVIFHSGPKHGPMRRGFRIDYHAV